MVTFVKLWYNIKTGTSAFKREFSLWLSRLRTWLISVRMWVWSLASLSGLRIQCLLWAASVSHRHSLDLLLPWLWHRPAAAAPIRPLAWAIKGKKIDSYGVHFFFFLLLLLLFCLFRATPVAYGSSQARGRIGAAATSLHHSHSNAGSEQHLWPTLQLVAMPDP